MEGVIKASNNNVNVEAKAEQVVQPAQTVVTPTPVTVATPTVTQEANGEVSVLSLKKAIITSQANCDIDTTAKALASYLITIPSYIYEKAYSEGMTWYSKHLDAGHAFAVESYDRFMGHAIYYYMDSNYKYGGSLFSDFVNFKASNKGDEIVCTVDKAIDFATEAMFTEVVAEQELKYDEVMYLLRMLEILAPVANNNIVKTFNSLINNNNSYSQMSAKAIDFVFTGLGYERNKEI